MKLLIIEADTNDGDYIHSLIDMDKQVDLTMELVNKVTQAISKSSQRHNWNISEYKRETEKDPQQLYKDILTEEEIDTFDQCAVPHGEYGIHTIKSITLYEVSEKTVLL